jgi:hypothetical protein
VNRDQPSRSAELDRVRKMLFPELPAEEGWARIDAAIARATAEPAIDEDLLDTIRRLRDQRDDDEE